MKTYPRNITIHFLTLRLAALFFFLMAGANSMAQITISGASSTCEGTMNVVYSATPGTSTYTWTVSSGGTITSGLGTSTITVTWGDPSEQLVSVDATGGSPSGSASMTVTVNERPEPTITGTDTICQGTSGIVYFTEPGMSGYTWSITPSSSYVTGPVANAITAAWASSGMYTMTVNYTNGYGCTASTPANIPVLVNPAAAPVITATSGSSIACTGTSKTYTTTSGKNNYNWTLSSGGTITSGSGTNAITVLWNTTGTHTITVTYVEPSTGCWTLTPGSIAITVNESPVPDITGADTVCTGTIYTFSTETGKALYTWTVGTGATILSGGGTSSITVTFNTSGSSYVSLNYTDPAGGCPAVTPTVHNVYVSPTPSVTPIASHVYCHGAAVPVTVLSGPVAGTTFSWNNDNPLIGLPVSGFGNVDAFTASNTTTTTAQGLITITPTANGCTGSTTTYTVTVNPTPTVNDPTDQVPCNGALTTAVIFSGTVTGTTYSWTNNNPSINLDPSGSGNIGAFTATNAGNTPVTALITVTPQFSNGGVTCSGSTQTFTITVNPTPSVTAISNQVYCHGTAVPATTVSGPVAGTVYSWTNNNELIGLPGSGMGDIPAFTASNTTTTSISGMITITPVAGGCTGSTTTYTITVNPVPTVTGVGNQQVCNGSPTTAVSFTGSVTGTVYNWTNSQPSIGLSASGSGDIASFAATNTGTTAVTALITITPEYTNGGVSCEGSTTTFTITVDPQLQAGSLTASQTVCYGQIPALLTATAMSGGMSPYGYEWEESVDGSSFTTIAGATTLTYQPGVLTQSTWYRVKQTSSGGCGTVYTNAVKITVNPLPVPVISGPESACLNSTNNTYATVSGMSAYQWNVNGGIITAGGTATSTSVTVTWNILGTQNVSLNYTTPDGCTAANPSTKTVTVQNIIIPTITGTAMGCTGTSYTYTTESGMLNYVWALPLGGGTITAGQGSSQITVLWNTAGSRSVSVIYNDAMGCTTTTPTVKAVTVNTSPLPTITGTTPICQGSTGVVYFTEEGMSGYTWGVTGGTITSGSTGHAIEVSWTAGGTQSVTVNYTNGSGCPAPVATTKQITVLTAATPTITGPTTACTGTTGYYTTEGGMTNYVWAVSSGGTITSGSGTNSIGVTWSTTGTHTVTVTYLNAQSCPTLTAGSRGVTVNLSPEPTITGADTVCLDGSLTFTTEPGMALYTWTVGAGGLITSGAGTSQITVKWTQAGSRTVSVNYTNPVGGCAAVTATVKNITVYTLPVPTISGPSFGCTGGSGYVFSTEAGMANYAWSVSTGGTVTPATGTSSVTASWTTAGLQSINVSYTDTHGCSSASSTSYNITINARPSTPVISGPAGACAGSVATYSTATGMTTYTWSVSSGGTILTSPSIHASTIQVQWNTTGEQTVGVNYTNISGCDALSPGTMTTTVHPLPVVNAVDNQAVCNGSPTAAVTFSGTGTSYSWTNSNPSIGLAASGTGNIASFTATNTGNAAVTALITVTPQIIYGEVLCTGSTTTFTITVYPTPSVNIIANQEACNGTFTLPVTFSGPVTGTIYNWTNSNPSIGLASTGTGDIASFTAINTSATPATATITVTPSINPATGLTCEGEVMIFSFTIYPTPVVNPVSNQEVCHEGMTTAVTFSGTGTTYTWTNSNPSIGLPSTGTGDIASFTAINTGAAPATATITVTPAINPAMGLTCTGQPITFSYMVYPQMLAGAATASQSVCYNAAPLALTATAPTGGTAVYSYLWQASADNVTYNDIAGATSLTYQPGVLTQSTWYRVKQTSSGGCGTVYTNAVKITVNALPVPVISGPAAACINSTGNIYSTQAGMSGYNWSVTGGVIVGPSNQGSVSVTWNTAGLQVVSVIYTDNNNCTAASASTLTVTVQSTIIPTIAGSAMGCTGTSYTYTTESGMLNYVWALPLGGGTITAGQGTSQVTVLWNNAGNRSVSVLYTDILGCTVTTPTEKPVTVNASPVPNITGLGSICQGSTGVVYFTETGMAGYTWNVTGGIITVGNGTSAISVNWITAGTQSVTVNYVNLAGCPAPLPTTKLISVQPAAAPVITGPSPVCTGTTTYYSTESGMTNYIWNLGSGGTIVSGAGTNSIGVHWSAAGTHNISVTYLNAQGCPTLVPGSFSVIVNLSPEPTITGADTVCLDGTLIFSTEPGMAIYNWTVGAGGLITSGQGTDNISVKWTQPGVRTVSVNYVNPVGGCSGVTAAVKNITIFSPPVPVISGPLYGCTGGTGSVFTTDAGMTNYLWSATPDGVITAGAGTNSITATWNTAGLQSVFVTYTDQHGCNALTPGQFNLAINPRPPDPVITGSSAVCAGTIATYSTQPGLTVYQWTVSEGGTILTNPSSYASTINVLWHTAGTQTVSVNYFNNAGCSALNTAGLAVMVNPLPAPTLTGPATACINVTGNTYITEPGQTNYSWDVSPGGTITDGGTSTTNFVTITWTTTGQKQVSVNYTTLAGCTSASAKTHTVTVNALPVPSVSGPSTGCMNVSGNVYLTEPGMTSYFWTVTAEGVITAGQGTRSVTITWLSAGSPIITVNYMNSNGCQAVTPTPLMVTVNAVPSPTITSFSDPTDVVCQNTGGHIYFSEPGMSSYSWSLTGPAGSHIISGGTQSTSNIYWGGPGPATGNLQVSVTNGAGCTGTSPVKTISITQPVPVSVSITASANPSQVATPVTFTAIAVNGGSAPVYQWQVNGINAGINSPDFTYIPSAGDSVKCILTSSYFCVVNQQATSNTIVMSIVYGVPCPGIPTVTYQGKTYHTVQIGTQCWFRENLNVGTRINGNLEQTDNGTIEKYCYNDLDSNCDTYGGLYQWNELMQFSTIPGIQGICPPGWHIPIDEEWSLLTSFLGGESVSGGKLKEVGTIHWSSPNTGAENTSGFTALGGGLRHSAGTFGNLKEYGYFQSSSENSLTNAWTRYVNYNLASVARNLNNKSIGFSVRCIKDTCTNYPPVSVSITSSANPVCAGTSVVFTAYPVNGGQNPHYQWKVNGINAGTNNAMFTYVPSANDMVTCVLTSSLPSPCLSGNPAISNPVTMMVDPLPVPTITGPVSVCPGIGGMVYNTESGMSGYIWTVSPGGTITAGQGTNAITVTWNTSGTQSVTVNYVNFNGCIPASPSVKTVFVNQLTIPTLSGPSQACYNQTVTYFTEPGMALYNWNVGSGGVITSGLGTSMIMVKWVQAGSQTVTVNYTNPMTGCQGLAAMALPVSVHPLPVPAVNGPSVACLGSVGFTYSTDPGMSNYTWIVSNGGMIVSGAGTQTVTVVWTATGAQSIGVAYTTINGCNPVLPTIKNVTVNSQPADPVLAGPVNGCAGPFIHTYSTDPGMIQYNWFVSAGGTILTTPSSGASTISVMWNVPGNQSVGVSYVTPQGCTTNITNQYVQVFPPVQPTIMGPSSACISTPATYVTEPGMQNYNWNISAGGSIVSGAGTNAISVVWNTTGNHSISVNYLTPDGCTAAMPAIAQVSVYQVPVPTITGTGALCPGSSGVVYFTESGMTNYTWTISAGGIITAGAGTNAITVSWLTPGTQSLTVNYTNPDGCQAITPTVKNVIVYQSPVPVITGPGQACTGSILTYSTEPGMNYYQWTVSPGGTILQGENTNNVLVHWTTTGPETLTVSYIDVNGCNTVNPTVLNVMVNPLPVPVISELSSSCTGMPGATYSTDQGMTGYLWTVSPGGSILSGQGTAVIVVNWSTPGAHTVTVTYTDQNGCTPMISTVKNVFVNPRPVPLLNGPGAACMLDIANYSTDAGMAGYLWSVSPGGVIISGANTAAISVQWTDAGQQTVSVSYTDPNGCQAVPATKTVTVNSLVIPTITGPAQSCTGNTVSYSTEPGMTGYTWAVSQGGTILSGAGTAMITVQWNTVGNHTVSVNYIPAGCPAIVPTVLNVTVDATPVPTITGPSSSCPVSGVVYTTESGKNNYLWTILPGGVITGGQGTNVITVSWQTPGPTGLAVNYSTTGGCRAIYPTSKSVTVLQAPSPTITGVAQIEVGQNAVYTTEAGMSNYTWSVSQGGTILSGTGSNSILVNWHTSGNQSIGVSVTNSSGCQSPTPVVYAVKVMPPSGVWVQNETILPGQVACFDAVQTLTVAGSGTYVVVQPGGSANFIAGQKILFMPGTTVQEGGYIHGYITTNGIYCGMNAPSFVTVPTSVEPTVSVAREYGFKVYPNPTEGLLHIEFTGDKIPDGTRYEVFSMKGERILTGELRDGNRHEISLAGRATGIYILRIVSGDIFNTFRIIKQ